MTVTEPKAPWLSSYGDVPHHLDYSTKSMSGAVFETAEKDGNFPALTFMGRKIKYTDLVNSIDKAAKAFYNIGVRPGDRVLLCMPNVPQAVYSLYALNRIGAVAAMVHPLSAVGEIVDYLNEIGCDYAMTLDQFYFKFTEVIQTRQIKKLIICSISDELSFLFAPFYKLFSEKKLPQHEKVIISWKKFIKEGAGVKDNYVFDKDPNTEAVVLFSGGTTGVTKGIKLSDFAFNANAKQTVAMSHEEVRHAKMLAAMPVFHGFGLEVCIHTMMFTGGTSILVPRFNPKSYAHLIKKHKPNFIAGVPTLFEVISSKNYLDGVDLSCLRGVFSGGDSLPVDLKKKFDEFLAQHNARVRIREGYGMTECISASCLTPYNKEKVGSIGLPYPDTYFQICAVGTNSEVPYGKEGEICIFGPTVMLGYISHEDENENTLRLHEDGNIWLHTGDLGVMDSEGFVYFRQRIKRMIITNGYNVYPSQLEKIINNHKAVKKSCVIGVPDPKKIQKVKAIVILEEGFQNSQKTKDSIMAHCRKHIAKYALPYEIEIKESLPTTAVGKIAYTELS